MCPNCKAKNGAKKFGFFYRQKAPYKVQRYLCIWCNKTYSDQSWKLSYWQKKSELNQEIFRMLASCVSQRRIAVIKGIDRKTVDRRVPLFAKFARFGLDQEFKGKKLNRVMFDEMESFEHSKCKPLTMPIAICPKDRKILSLDVAPIAAKGNLAKVSLKKYGPRKCERKRALNLVFDRLKSIVREDGYFLSDKSPHYPKVVAKYFPKALHEATKGRKPCVVGQGELKEGAYDPLFMLNHTYAMIRDGIKRLTRKTWTTTKKPERLKEFLQIYAWFHNKLMDVRIENARRKLMKKPPVSGAERKKFLSLPFTVAINN